LNRLIVGNLVHRPLRSLISALAVAIEVMMILSITGLMIGMLNGSRRQTSGSGMDMLVRPGAASALMNTSGASASVKVADKLDGLPHVAVAAPLNIKLTLGSSLENIYGIDYATYNALRPFAFTSGGPFSQPDDVMIDDLQASSGKTTKVGDYIKVLNRQFRVCGIFAHGKGARKFIPLATMDEIDATPGKASAFFLRLDDMRNAEAVKQEILATPGMQQYNVQTAQEVLASLTPDHLPGFNTFMRIIIGIAVVVGFLVIFQSMYTAVMERTREIGILKSMGASQATIVSVVLRETGLLAVTGIVLGVLATYLLRTVLHAKFPTLSFELTQQWLVWAILLTLLGALLGALYPALKAARKDPIDALSYE
jgi:putative ABC transport system permease protein